MKRIFAILMACLFMVAIMAVTTSVAFAAEHHPPKFGVKSTQCGSGANQPNCPGSH